MKTTVTQTIARRHGLGAEDVEAWEALSETERERRYEDAKEEARSYAAYRRAKVLGAVGAGLTLTVAVEALASELRTARREAESVVVTCSRTGAVVPETEAVTVGDTSVAFSALSDAEAAFLGVG